MNLKSIFPNINLSIKFPAIKSLALGMMISTAMIQPAHTSAESHTVIPLTGDMDLAGNAIAPSHRAYIHIHAVQDADTLHCIENFIRKQRELLKPDFEAAFFSNYQGVPLTPKQRVLVNIYQSLETIPLTLGSSTAGVHATYKPEGYEDYPVGAYYDQANIGERSTSYIAYVHPSDTTEFNFDVLMDAEMVVSAHTSQSVPWFTTLGIMRVTSYTGPKHPGIAPHLLSAVAMQFPKKTYLLHAPLPYMRDVLVKTLGTGNTQILRETEENDRWILLESSGTALSCKYMKNAKKTFGRKAGKKKGKKAKKGIPKRVSIPNYSSTWFAANPTAFTSSSNEIPDSHRYPLFAAKQSAFAEIMASTPYIYQAPQHSE